MFSEHVKRKSRLVIKPTKLKNIQLEKIQRQSVNQLKMNSLTGSFTGKFSHSFFSIYNSFSIITFLSTSIFNCFLAETKAFIL